MKITTTQMLRVLYILSWIIFIGVCVEAGAFIFNTFITMMVNPVDARRFWREVDLSALYGFDKGYFLVQSLLMCIVAVMRCILFYLIVKILHDKKLDMAQPFNRAVGRFLFNIAYVALFIGLFSYWGSKYAQWLGSLGVKMPDVQQLRLGGADVWLFMGVTLLVVSHIFKRGIEIQTENELTV
jgi:hypothetical protein